MRNKEVLKLIIGFRRFKEKYFQLDGSTYKKQLSIGQSPKTLIIGCSDSRVDPAILTSASPGELFVVRNVANLVPPHEEFSKGFHGVSAAIEFAVKSLKVENIFILGHRQCGGIRALMTGDSSQSPGFVGQWMKIAEPAKKLVIKSWPNESFEAQCRHCEMESILISIENLKTFPFVEEAIVNRSLTIHGVYFDLENGTLFEFDETQKGFRQIHT